jgi:hypothetical protein
MPVVKLLSRRLSDFVHTIHQVDRDSGCPEFLIGLLLGLPKILALFERLDVPTGEYGVHIQSGLEVRRRFGKTQSQGRASIDIQVERRSKAPVQCLQNA